MTRCDICGARGCTLIALRDTYKTAEIEEICPDCEKAVNSHLSKLQVMGHNIVRDLLGRFMAHLRSEQEGGI